MTSQQFSEWAAFAAVEPFGDGRDDYRLAYALSVIVNMLKASDSPPVSPIDLLPRVGVLAEEGQIVGPGNEPAKHASVQAFEQAAEEYRRRWGQ